MIVTCERCATQFQLDDSRVPETGVRVRCSRCKHAFKVAPVGGSAASPPSPEPAPSPSAAAAVHDATTDESGDLFGTTSPPGASDDEESDWQFNEDPPRADDSQPGVPIGETTAASVVDDLLGDAAAPPSSLPPSASVAPPEPTTEAAASPESNLELDIGGAGLDLAADEPPASASIEIGQDAPGSGLELADDGEPAATNAAQSPVSPPPSPDEALDTPSTDAGGDAPEDELGSPSEWDLFGAKDRREEEFGAEVTSVPEGLAFELAREDLDEARPAWLGWAARAGGVAGWLGVIALFVAGLFQGITGPLRAQTETPVVASLAGFAVESEGRWVDHLVAGPVYVVSGTVRNTSPRRERAPALALTLHDDHGRMLGDAPQPVTLARSDRERREAPVTSEGQPLHAAGTLGPGDERRFEVMVGRLPKDVSRFRVVQVARPAAPVVEAPVADVPPSDPDAADEAEISTTQAEAESGADDAVAPNPAPPSRKALPASVPAARAPAAPSS